jgi:hypothetical protein
MSKLSDFLTNEKIDPRRVIAASHRVESLQPGDRVVRLARHRVRKGSASDAEKERAQGGSPRSGRPVTPPTLDRALSGKSLPRKAKQRIVRAVNHVRTQRKQPEVQRADLF